MKFFSLFVNGKDVDTGKYEYFPYADKSISDFKKTYKIISELKKGKTVEDADKYVYAKYCVGNDDLNKKAIDAAHKASIIMKDIPLSKRGKIIYDIGKKFKLNKEKILKLLIIEGHPKKLAEWEINSLDNVFNEETIENYKKFLFENSGIKGREKLFLIRKPDGVVVLVPPKNAPASNSVSAVYCFLAANAIIVKAPLKMPISTIFLWKNIIGQALKENGAPDGIMNIITGNSKNITDEWVQNPKVKDIFFFGESKKGLEIAQRAFDNNKKAILELSGNDTMFIWKDCDIDSASDSALDAFLGSTQICMLPKNIIVHEKIYDKFMEKFLFKVKNLKFGLPSDEQTYFTPVVRMKDCQDFLCDALNKGANLLCGGKRVNFNGISDERGIYFQPTLVEIESDNSEIFNMKLVKEENFFPVIPVIKVKSSKKIDKEKDKEIFQQMLNFARQNEYGLRVSVWVKSPFYIKRFIKYIDNCAMLRINSRHICFSSLLPGHGGTGKTGGPYGEASYLVKKMTHLQSISLTN